MQVQALQETFNTEADVFYVDMQITNDLAIVTFFYPVRITLEYIYSVKTQKPFHLVTTNNLLDMALTIVFSYRFYKESIYRQNLVGLSTHDMHLRYYENIYVKEDDGDELAIVYAIASGILWLKILLLMRLTRILGPLVTMLRFMMIEIGRFMLLYVTMLLVFACVGTLLFSDTVEYDTLPHSMRTLFDASLANTDFAIFETSKQPELVGVIYLVLFVITSHVLILNLLIAILATTHQSLEERKIGKPSR